jgi:hypothetical protein
MYRLRLGPGWRDIQPIIIVHNRYLGLSRQTEDILFYEIKKLCNIHRPVVTETVNLE